LIMVGSEGGGGGFNTQGCLKYSHIQLMYRVVWHLHPVEPPHTRAHTHVLAPCEHDGGVGLTRCIDPGPVQLVAQCCAVLCCGTPTLHRDYGRPRGQISMGPNVPCSPTLGLSETSSLV
jgi:hypothetical protein